MSSASLTWQRRDAGIDAPQPRHSFSLVVINDGSRRLVMTGGCGDQGLSREISIYDGQLDRWTLWGNLRKPLSEHCGGYWQGHVALYGGREGAKHTSAVHILQIETGKIDTYTKLTNSPQARSQHCSAVLPAEQGGGMVIHGGYGGRGVFLDDWHILQRGE